jgi:predicted nucleotidyltransferase
MQPFIAAKQQELTSLCRRYHVRRLELFGSAAAGAFDSATSDLDFLVELEDRPTRLAFLFRSAKSLAALPQRPVDLFMPPPFTAPISCAASAKPVLFLRLRPKHLFDIKCREPIMCFTGVNVRSLPIHFAHRIDDSSMALTKRDRKDAQSLRFSLELSDN